MIDDIIKKLQLSMTSTIEKFRLDLSTIRTGRAHPSILSKINISYHNTRTAISCIASVTVPDSRTLLVTPWEKELLNAIEKEIISANLGLVPLSLGNHLRISVPKLSKERRIEMIKLVRTEAEEACVSIRNIRRNFNSQLKLLKEKKLSDDQISCGLSRIQELTNEMIKKVKLITTAKEKELTNI
jgi:ribosome recycling factor